METVSFLSDAFTLFLHLPKKKGASGSRDGWHPGLISTNEPLQNKFQKEREQQDLPRPHRKQMPC